MFGKNKVNVDELQRIKETLEQIVKETADNASMFEANYSEIEDSQRQMEVNVTQVSDNIRSTAQLAEQSITMETNLSHVIRETVGRMKGSELEYAQLVEQLHGQVEECLALVDQNKHFTSPSKALNEGIGGIRSQNEEYLEALEKIQEGSKQIGVLALNSAIEAGRMGDSGKQFVSAAEEIRSFAADFESATAKIIQQMKEEQEHVAKMEEQIHKLVGLLKDNNVSMSKLLKMNQNTIRMVERSSIRPYSTEVAEWKEQIIGLRNTEEEILKLQERNKMQLEDITSEVQAQKNASREVSDELTPMFGHAAEYLDMSERKESF